MRAHVDGQKHTCLVVVEAAETVLFELVKAICLKVVAQLVVPIGK